MIRFFNTRHGFVWGCATITRLMTHRGSVVLGIKTSYRDVEISVSPTGRSVRVWRDGRELT